MTPDQISCLQERCGYLTERIKAKQNRNWETTWDQRERDALAAALDALTPKTELFQPGVVDNGRTRAFSAEVRQATQERVSRAGKRL